MPVFRQWVLILKTLLLQLKLDEQSQTDDCSNFVSFSSVDSNLEGLYGGEAEEASGDSDSVVSGGDDGRDIFLLTWEKADFSPCCALKRWLNWCPRTTDDCW